MLVIDEYVKHLVYMGVVCFGYVVPRLHLYVVIYVVVGQTMLIFIIFQSRFALNINCKLLNCFFPVFLCTSSNCDKVHKLSIYIYISIVDYSHYYTHRSCKKYLYRYSSVTTRQYFVLDNLKCNVFTMHDCHILIINLLFCV